jgi:hypothetical protein
MKTIEERALEYLENTKWLRGSEKHKELVKFINKEREIMRRACSEAISDFGCGEVDIETAASACWNTKAL